MRYQSEDGGIWMLRGGTVALAGNSAIVRTGMARMAGIYRDGVMIDSTLIFRIVRIIYDLC